MIYPENIVEYLFINEVSLSKGGLYAFVTNKKRRGKKGTLVASIKSTKSQDVINILSKIRLNKLELAKEIILDMANNMQLASRMVFPQASTITHQFTRVHIKFLVFLMCLAVHIVKLVLEALQHSRITDKWAEIDKENLAAWLVSSQVKLEKEQNIKYIAATPGKDDTPTVTSNK